MRLFWVSGVHLPDNEWHVTDGYSLVAACNVDGGDVVGQPIFWLGGAVVFGCVPRERESLRELLGPDARSEAAVSRDIFFLDEG